VVEGWGVLAGAVKMKQTRLAEDVIVAQLDSLCEGAKGAYRRLLVGSLDKTCCGDSCNCKCDCKDCAGATNYAGY